MDVGDDAENDAGVMSSIIELDSVERSPLLCLTKRFVQQLPPPAHRVERR
jgi:hypothetical protein